VLINNVEIYAESILSFKVHDGELKADAEDLSTVNVTYNEDAIDQVECSSCHRELTEYPDGYTDDDGHRTCDDSAALHTPVQTPLTWLNSAAINPDPDENSVTVTLSVGDPRGAFAMTLRKVDDKIYLHLPHQDMPSPHMPLSLVTPGTYRVGS
jgi:hypothetical protein